MPAINSGTVLVTGASGFLGTYVVQELLQRGFKVRAVVRDDKKGEYLQKNWPGTEYVIVEEMNAVSTRGHDFANASPARTTTWSRASTAWCTSRRRSTSATRGTRTR